MPRPFLALIAATLLAAPAGAQPAPDARALLQQVTDAYRALTSYHYEGTMAIQMIGSGMDTTLTVPVTMAADRAGRSHVEVLNPAMSVVMVSDGKQTTTYLPGLGQYMRKPAEAPAGADSAMPRPPQGTPILRYFSPLEGLVSGSVTGSQAVALAGTSSDCWVVRVDVTPPGALSRDSTARSVTTYWVDKARHLILRDSTHITMRNPATGAPMEVRQATIWTLGRFDQPLEDALFAFTAPAGAREVASFGGPGSQAESELVGTKAPPFTLADLKGRNVSLASLRGRVVVLDFWATWCGPCRVEMPRVQNVHAAFKDRGLAVFGVNFAEEPRTVRTFMAKNTQYTFPILLDKDGAVGDKYKAVAIPTLVVIGRDGLIKAWHQGVRDEQVLRDAVAKALAEKAPAARAGAGAAGRPKAAAPRPTAAPKPATPAVPKK